MRPSARKINHMRVIREYKQSLSEKDLYYCVSDLIDGHIDFDQWEFCVVWATRISFLPVLPAVSPFINLFPLVTSRSRERFQNESVHLYIHTVYVSAVHASLALRINFNDCTIIAPKLLYLYPFKLIYCISSMASPNVLLRAIFLAY